MTTKVLTGKYLSGYTLTSAWTGIQVNASAVVAGVVGANGSYGGSGGAGGIALDLPNSVTGVNHGFIGGGAGGNGGVNDYNGGAGGVGGVGVSLASGGVLTNTNAIYGGMGGYGGYGSHDGGAGGHGGAGVWFAGAGTLTNTGVIQGGYGGNGGAGKVAGGQGGIGADGVYLGSGGRIVNLSRISAGRSGTGGFSYDTYAVVMEHGGVLINGSSTNHLAQLGNGVLGVLDLSYSGSIVNYGAIDGSSLSVNMGSARLIAESGSYFGGLAYSESGTLELAGGAGTLANLGSTLLVSGSISGAFSGFKTYQLDAGGNWTFTGANVLNKGKTLSSSVDVAIAAGGSLSVEDGATFFVQGQVSSGGTIALDSAAANTDIRILSGGVGFDTGVVDMTGPRARILGASPATQLDNYATIVGQGWIGLGSLSVVNQSGALIDAVGKQGLVIDTKGGSLSNVGVIAAESGSTLVLMDNVIAQASNAGVIAALSGGRVDLEGDEVSGGTLSQAGSGVFTVNANGSELTGFFHTLTIAGAIQVIGGVALTIDGAIVNGGKLNTVGGAKVAKLIIGSDGATLSGGGQVNLTASANNIIVGAASGDVLTNTDNRIAGAGDIGAGSMGLVNGGQIVGNSAVTLTLDTGATKITNSGLIEAVSTGQVVVKSAVANTGSLFAAAGTLTLDGAVTGAGGAQIKSGVLNLAAAFGETVTFLGGATGQLRLTDFKDFTGTVAGFSKTGTNTIDLAGFTLSGAKATYSGTTATGVLTVSNGTQSAHIKLTGNYVASTFNLTADGHGGVLIKDPSAPLAQAIAAMPQPPPHALASPAYASPRMPIFHVRA